MRNKKKTISKKLKEEVWIKHFGEIFSAKCPISWCSHKITVFCFEAGHNIPESKGGRTAIDNLIPICGECNRSMGDRYTIDEWNAIQPVLGLKPVTLSDRSVQTKRTWGQFFSCLHFTAGKPPEPRQPTSPSRRATQ